MSPGPFESDATRPPERVEAVTAALAGWRRQLSTLGGANTLLWYVEQPTGRDIVEYAYDWRPVTARKPVLLDEGLTGPERMATAAEQGSPRLSAPGAAVPSAVILLYGLLGLRCMEASALAG